MRKPRSLQHATRQLAHTQQALAAARSLPATDWRQAATKAQTLRRLEALERKWRNVLEPEPVRMRFW